eukprot:COSAG02_NODE_7970_length_2766_cov_1.593551_2_plen_215_part_00
MSCTRRTLPSSRTAMSSVPHLPGFFGGPRYSSCIRSPPPRSGCAEGRDVDINSSSGCRSSSCSGCKYGSGSGSCLGSRCGALPATSPAHASARLTPSRSLRFRFDLSLFGRRRRLVSLLDAWRRGAAARVSSLWQLPHTLCRPRSAPSSEFSAARAELHGSQKISPQRRQWWRRRKSPNGVLVSHTMRRAKPHHSNSILSACLRRSRPTDWKNF